MAFSSLFDPLFCQEQPFTIEAEDEFYKHDEVDSAELFSSLINSQLKSYNFASNFTNLNSPYLHVARKEAVQWIKSTSSQFGFSALTVLLAVNYLDRCFLCSNGLSLQEDKPWMNQLSAVACLSLAAKIEETQVPFLLDLQLSVDKVSSFVYELKTVRRMELLILSTLGWRMNPVTSINFIQCILPKSNKHDDNAVDILKSCERILISVLAEKLITKNHYDTCRIARTHADYCVGLDIEEPPYTQAKDVVKAVKKRLQHKNPRVQFLALTLLETMIKNCGEFVHFQVADRGILQEMVKIVRKKTDMQVREKILVLLDSWQEAFGGPGGRHPQYYWAYTELKRSGVDFPQRSPDSALIFTPPVTHPALPPPRYLQIGYGMPSNSSVRLDEAMASEMTNLSSADLDSYRSVMELLSDMLKAVNPGDREAVKDEVIADLVDQCRSNQKKLMQFVNSAEDEELLAQGLALNDDLQSLLAKHDAIASGSPLPAEASESAPEKTAIVPMMSTITSQSEVEEEEEDDDDDDFAQLARRNSKYKQTMTSSDESAEANAAVGSISEPSSSSVGCNVLALPDPPAPIKTSSDKEQDMIDLLSLTLSSNPSPPRTPLTPPSASFQNGPTSPFNPQRQPYLVNQGYAQYNSYVAPWAQPQPQPQPWAQSQPQMQPQQPWVQPQPQIPLSYPPPPWEATSSANLNPFMNSYLPMHAAQPQQQYNSFNPRAYNFPANNAQANVNPRQAGFGASPKPYVHSDKLFNDLVDLGATADKSAGPDGTLPTMSGSSGKSPIGGRKE